MLCDSLEGWDGIGWEAEEKFKRERIYVHCWLNHVVIQQKSTQHCKATILQLKVKLKKKKNTIIKVREHVKRRKLSFTVSENVNCCSHYGNSMEISQEN